MSAGKTETLGRVGSSADLQPTPGFAPPPAAPDSVSTNAYASENGGASQSGWDDLDAGAASPSNAVLAVLAVFVKSLQPQHAFEMSHVYQACPRSKVQS